MTAECLGYLLRLSSDLLLLLGDVGIECRKLHVLRIGRRGSLRLLNSGWILLHRQILLHAGLHLTSLHHVLLGGLL